MTTKQKSLLITVISFIQLIVFYNISFAQGNIITVSGSVKFNEPLFKMSIVRQVGNERVTVAEFDVDENNKFSYQMKVDEPGVYTLDCKKWESIQFWAEDENLNVDFRGKDTARIKIKNPPFHMIKGGPKNEVMNHLNFISFRAYQGMIAVSRIGYNTKYLNDSVKSASTSSLYEYLNEERSSQVRYIVELYSDRTSVVAALRHLNPEKDRELIEKTSKEIFSRHPGYTPLVKYIKEAEEKAANSKRMAIGSIAPDFEYASTDGKLFGPSKFKGKILLIDFWASWCGPCRAEIPNLKKVYEKYDRKDVEFLSVSIDKGEAEWKKALGVENMPWPQILAPKSGTEVSKLYQFSGIPFLVIIGKDGKIASKYIRGEDEITKEINKALGK